MLTETIQNALSNAVKAITKEPNDPLFKQMEIPPSRTLNAFQNLFLGMTYFLKFKVKAAKENDLKKYGIYAKSLDQFVIGAYITVIDNDGEDSVVLDFTFDEDKFTDMIEAGCATSIDDPAFIPYSSASTSQTPVMGPNGEALRFYIIPEYIHTVYVITAMVLKHHIEELLDDPNIDHSVTLEGYFTATGFIDDDGQKKVSIELDETIKQMIKNDDANAIHMNDVLDSALKSA